MKRFEIETNAGIIALVMIFALVVACEPTDPTATDADTSMMRVDTDTANPPNDTDIVDDTGEPDTGPTLDLPVDLSSLPDNASAPWPGDGRIVHGGYLKVVHVLDGDTLLVETGDGEKKIRLKAVDAPACNGKVKSMNRWSCDPNDRRLSGDGEYFGVEAWQKLRDMVEGKTVRIACQTDSGETCNTGPFDRSLAWLVLDDKTDASRELAATGHAWTFTKYASENVDVYCRAENRARGQSVGMWEHPDKIRDAMNNDTKSWYSRRDSICSDALKN